MSVGTDTWHPQAKRISPGNVVFGTPTRVTVAGSPIDIVMADDPINLPRLVTFKVPTSASAAIYITFGDVVPTTGSGYLVEAGSEQKIVTAQRIQAVSTGTVSVSVVTGRIS